MQRRTLDGRLRIMTACGKSPCVVSAFALLVAMAGNTAHADQIAVASETPPPTEHTQTAPEEIVVTAQKRAEKMKDVPISISAVSGTELAERRIEGIEDISRSVPGVSF